MDALNPGPKVILPVMQKYAVLAALYFGLTGIGHWSWGQALLSVALLWTILSQNTIYILYHTFGRDARAGLMMVRLMLLVKKAEFLDWTVPKMFHETVSRIPDKIMFYFEDSTWTFSEVDKYSNRIANYFLSLGFKKGDSVALFMENRPEYVGIWLGLSKIGAVPALINHSLRQESLIHSIHVADCKSIVFSSDVYDAVGEVIASVKNGYTEYSSFCLGPAPKNSDEHFQTVMLEESLLKTSDGPVDKVIQDSIGFKDKLMYIYTSGTTGMPKAAVIKHSRYILAAGGCHFVIGVRKDDIIYSPLPLYHSVAGMIAMAGSMLHGMSIVMKKKFSASSYWKDCIKFNVTAAQYIGELCRYLLNTPQIPEEKEHKVRLMFGNGLRQQIWVDFVQRFGIEKIAEFYGSTEGNSQIINIENKVGAVGFVSLLFPNILPLGLVKVDEETGAEVRDKNGLCITCQPGEPGEFVGKIVRNHPVRDFHGYADEKATQKKLLCDVRTKGDLFFRSGDVLVMDDLGWLYFKDRSGDTFRWRGENVSTVEVESILSNIIDLKDAIVYGVQIPGTEGRAGMAAIHDPDEIVDLEKLASGLKAKLPAFARPLFVRLVDHFDITGTYKLKKFNLQREGFDPDQISDKMYFLNPKSGLYEALDAELFKNIVSGSIRL
ncbi:long-chain fatty acid transport protein 4-like isoform X2 [Tigriopus californicus]|uniref:long-chain fatty acid transport protein 4-like isoform X2 n=1 Tax=Tigriopus californicus TaxID=6832 RepID=UPI0027D9E9D9|nr:long-chain fatty acid transport protein 4-like isoform X2 [Tigriopus californicus]